MKKEGNRFSHKKRKTKKETSNKFESPFRFLCGERGSRTYAFKKYHKIANH